MAQIRVHKRRSINNFVREAEGSRWELKARNSAVQLCASMNRAWFFSKDRKLFPNHDNSIALKFGDVNRMLFMKSDADSSLLSQVLNGWKVSA